MNYRKYQYLLTSKHIQLLFGIYLFFLILMAVLPINGTTNTTLTDVFLVRIRLDHLLHAILFIPWVFLSFITFRPVKWNEKLILVVSGLLMAFATEGVQYFLTYRSYNINDLLANLIGVVVGMGVLIGRVGLLRWSEGAREPRSEGAKMRR